MDKQVKTWENVYVLRQEYNKYARKWFPAILFWERSADRERSWICGLFTEDGETQYYDEVKAYYPDITRAGTGKCDPEDVRVLVERYESDFADDLEDAGAFGGNSKPVEVKKLYAYRPGRD